MRSSLLSNPYNGDKQSPEIAVIGAGASAVCFLDVLVQSKGPTGGITLFEPGPHLWRGRPYQQDTELLRLNATPDDMSVRYNDPGQFERWLTARDLVVGFNEGAPDSPDPYSGARFVPRTVYGEYLEHSARTILMTLVEQGWRVTIIRDRVVSAAETTDGRPMLRTERNDQFQADYVVLCVGAGKAHDSYGLAESPRFLADPYPVSQTFDTLQGFDSSSAVGIIGSGLTAVDVVLALAARGHDGPISLLSRSGILPSVRQRPVAYELRHFTPERFRTAARQATVTLDTAVGMLGDELASAGESLTTIATEIAALSQETPAARLRRQLTEVDSAGIALRIMQTAVPESGPKLWPLLPHEEKSKLLQQHYRSILALCCPMPAASAATLLRLVDSGQLQIVNGVRQITGIGSTSARKTDNGFKITTDSRTLFADHIINAVNPPGHKIPEAAASLVDSLVVAGVATRHPLGGLQVDPDTSRLSVKGRANPRFYALGDLSFGSLLFTFGVPAIVNRAQEIGVAIHDHMSRLRLRPLPTRVLSAAQSTNAAHTTG